MEIKGFPLTSTVLQDPMHILLEGVLKNEFSALLYNLIYGKRYFTLKWLNQKLSNFPYSDAHKSRRPEPIDKKQHIDGLGSQNTLKQTAASMLTLCEVLPLLLGEKIPEGNELWENCLRLLQILILCASPYCLPYTASLLRILIAQYLHTMKSLFPRSNLTPKMHYLTHLPQQMLSYGPLRHHGACVMRGRTVS